MTANELADEIENYCYWTIVDFHFIKEAATMLRQQQAEIERLTMLCDCMTTESNRKGNKIEALKNQSESFDRTASHMAGEYVSYQKELTDEEMLESAEGAGCVFDYSYKGEVTFISKNALKRFVLAILRKAQEK